jgi:hypothetical protein
MFPCIYASSTRFVAELAAYRAIRDIEGESGERIDEYLDDYSVRYRNMVERR